jgi:hypothetical protein
MTFFPHSPMPEHTRKQTDFKLIQPAIDWVEDIGGCPRDRYCPGGLFKVSGWRFGDWEEVPTDVGLYLIPAAGGAPVRAPFYYYWHDGEIEGLWPLCVRGPQRLILETHYGDGDVVRSTTYARLLLP